ncbi:hypothetical protein VPHK567_0159 [Vibrio phage K567]
MKRGVERWKEEARENGLEYLVKVNNHEAIYRFINCQHEQKLRPGNIRLGHFKCSTCQDEKLHEEASECGLEYVYRVKDGVSTYRFIKCEHVHELRHDNVRNGHVKCSTCQDERLHEEASECGLEHVSRVKNNVSTYRFIKCEHVHELRHDNVRNGHVKCSTCQDNRWSEEASKRGLEHVSRVKNNVSTYRFIKCGHIQDIRRDNVRSGRFLCNTCETSAWEKPCGTYLMTFKFDIFRWCKVGSASDIESRINGFGLRNGVEVSVKYFHIQSNRRVAQNQVEYACHDKFKEHKLPCDLMKEFMQSGFTECYPPGMFGTLLHEISTNEAANADNPFTDKRFCD